MKRADDYVDVMSSQLAQCCHVQNVLGGFIKQMNRLLLFVGCNDPPSLVQASNQDAAPALVIMRCDDTAR